MGCSSKTYASFVFFWLRGAAQPPAPARWQRPRKGYGITEQGRKPSQQGVFLFQVEFAGQNVICDEKESGQEKDFQSDAQQQNNMNGPVIGYGENPLSSPVP